MNKNQYRLVHPPEEFWEALLQVRNYLYRDLPFAWFCCQYYMHKDPLAEAFWVVDNWLDAALLNE